MPSDAVFIFDSTYPSIDVALPIDDGRPHVAVSNRRIEPPPGHRSLQIEQETSLGAIKRNLHLLRAAWIDAGGCECIVMAASGVRPEQLMVNTLYALCLSRDVVFFDGVRRTPVRLYWARLIKCALLGSARLLLGSLVLTVKTASFNRRVRALADFSTEEGGLFGMYTSARSFSLPFDEVTLHPDGRPLYGNSTGGWYLPAFSSRLQRYGVRTTRHYLRNVSLHVERVGGFEGSALFKDGRILDYPYMFRSRRWYRYPVSSRAAIKTAARGINLLAYTSTYYHWLVEGVPRILDVIDDKFDFDRYPLLLPRLEPFQTQLLEILGIVPASQTITVDIGDWCHVAECVFPTANFPFAAPGLDDPSGQPDRALLLRIRQRLMERIGSAMPPSADSPSRLYISRAKAGRRKFSPEIEAAVTSLLEAAGFVRVCLEDFVWSEQVRLVAGAEFIVGLHGAGLANILFANAKGLLEIHNPLEARPYFAVMARELDIDYAFIIGSMERYSPAFDDITVDLRKLEQMVEQMIARSSHHAIQHTFTEIQQNTR
jgi:capsular polysaccharide biosynthesis protein